jgi:hypothetical protein
MPVEILAQKKFSAMCPFSPNACGIDAGGDFSMTKFFKSFSTKTLLPLAATAIAVWSQTALAQNMQINGPFTVTYIGQPADTIPGVSGCAGNIWVEAHGIGQTILGPMFFTVQKCYNLMNSTYAGTFVLCLSDAACGPNSQDSMSGVYAGKDDTTYDGHFPIVFGPFHGTLTVNAGTGRFEGARGTITFAAMSADNIQYNADGAAVPVHEGSAYYALRGMLSFRGN